MTTGFLYDGVNLAQELSGSTPTAGLLTGGGLDETFTRTDAGGRSTLLADALGSTIELADAAGALQTHYTFEPFGAASVAGSTSANAQQFSGRDNDGSGLYEYRTRYYQQNTGRFISEDPAGMLGGLNLYSYADDSPTNFTDPLGLFPGQMPPAPPGYDPNTWGHGVWDNGKPYVQSPDGRLWTAHPEDDVHWRHWDVQQPGGGDQRPYPEKSLKPEPGKKKKLETPCDPNGDAPEWKPLTRQPMSMPTVPFVPLPLLPVPAPALPLLPGLVPAMVFP